MGPSCRRRPARAPLAARRRQAGPSPRWRRRSRFSGSRASAGARQMGSKVGFTELKTLRKQHTQATQSLSLPPQHTATGALGILDRAVSSGHCGWGLKRRGNRAKLPARRRNAEKCRQPSPSAAAAAAPTEPSTDITTRTSPLDGAICAAATEAGHCATLHLNLRGPVGNTNAQKIMTPLTLTSPPTLCDCSRLRWLSWLLPSGRQELPRCDLV